MNPTKSGERIPSSGLYQIFHDAHTLPSQVALVKGYNFPPCAELRCPSTSSKSSLCNIWTIFGGTSCYRRSRC
jgi:hypothetical protein